MKKLKQYNVKFKKGYRNIEDIKLTQSLMWELLECYEGKEIDKKNQDIIVKYILPAPKKDEVISETAMEELLNGIEIDDKNYISFITSPGMMKKISSRKKCEYLFIKNENEYKDFKENYRDILSLGKINNLLEKDKLCINKDIIARESLSLSGSYKINHKPYLLILPDVKYKHISDYITIDKENGNLEKQLKVEKKFDAFDGCGLMSPTMADIIKKEINADYDIDFSIIRNFPLAVKGLVVKCDFIKFYNDIYVEDTEHFKKIDGEFYVKDIYDCWIQLSKVDLIVNTNMAKWAGLWDCKKDNLSDERNINDAIREGLESHYKAYSGVLNNLYVTKVNKEKVKEYTKISYQILNNLALLQSELEGIQQDTIKYLNKVIDLDVDYMKMFLGDLASEIEQDEDGNIINDLSASTKAHRLLQVSDKFKNNGTVKRVINSNIKKAAHEVVCRPYVKGHFKYAIDDPIAFLRWIMTRDLENSRELKESEFYSPKECNEKVVMTRNPLAIANEVHRIKLVENEMLDKYFGNITNEIIVFNTADNMGFISSGSDRDGDSHAIWYDERIYNAVIETELHFNFVDDGKKHEVKWSEESEFECVLKASGNLIGSVANITTKLSNKAQEQGYLIDGEHFTIGEIVKEYLSDKPDIVEKLENILKRIKMIDENIERLEEGKFYEDEDLETIDNYYGLKKIDEERRDKLKKEIVTEAEGQAIKNGAIPFKDLEPDKQRQIIKDGFKKYERDMLEALMWSQVAIDSSKTCVIPSKDDMHRIIKYKDKYKHKLPRFMYFAKWKSNGQGQAWDETKRTNSTLDISSKTIYDSLIKKVNALKKGSDSISAFKDVFNDTERNDEAMVDILRLFNKHCEKYNESGAIKNDDERKAFRAEYKLEILSEIENLNYSNKEIAYALLNIERITKKGNKIEGVTNEFIFTYCWEVVLDVIKDIKIDLYIEDENGEYDWLFKRYSKKLTSAAEDQLLKQEKEQLLKKIATHSFNVGALTGFESLIDYNKNLIIKEETEGKYNNLNIYIDDKKVGRIYRNSLKVEVVDGQVLTAKDYSYLNGKTQGIKITVAV